jgi:hypothetical protein
VSYALSLLAAGGMAAFTGGSHALPQGDSASPDAPASFVSYGPRMDAGLGLDLGVLVLQGYASTFRLGLVALVAFANTTSSAPVAGDIVRTQFALGPSWSLDRWAREHWGARGVLDFGVSLGRRSAFATEGYWLQDEVRQGDVPFGAGGGYLGFSAEARQTLSPVWDLSSRWSFRGYTNAWPDWFGAHEVADGVADALYEGASSQASIDVGLRWHWRETVQPVLWFYGDLIDGHDDNARLLWLTKLQLGGAIAADKLEWLPFTALEAGHGAGLLVNRTELRLNLGVKLYAR